MDNIYLQISFDLIHILATITWFGALFTNYVVVIPVASKVLDQPVFAKFMGALMKRNKTVVYVSLAALFITGIPMKIASEYYVSVISFSNDWQTFLFIKHVLVVVLAILAIINFEVIVPRVQRAASSGDIALLTKTKNIQAITGKLSFLLAFLIILFSAIINYL